MLEQVGKWYNFGATFLAQPWYQLTNKYWGFRNPNSRNCSQFAAKCLGFEWWYSADPQDLYREAITNEYIIKETATKRRIYVNNKLKIK
jgi:hypothetical protein